jgi:hypothetical protein
MSRRSRAKQKFGDGELVDRMFDADPSRGAYGEWMVRRAKAGEHEEAVIEAATVFHECKSRMPRDGRDLYAYGSVDELRRAIDEVGEVSARARRRSDPGYELVVEYPRISFYRVKTYEGMRTLGRGTTWCVTSKDDYEHFSDRMIVVAISRARDDRDPYSRFALVTDKRVDFDPLDFFPWDALKYLARVGLDLRWRSWDALDRNPRWASESSSGPLEEIMDLLAGRRGATLDAMRAAVGGVERVDALRDAFAVLRSHRARVQDVLDVAEMAAVEGLFNPLSLLLHPKVTGRESCSQVWRCSTSEHRDAVGTTEVLDVATRAAVNVPEIFDWCRERCRGSAGALFGALLENPRMTRDTKARVLAMASAALGLSEEGP